MDVVFDKLLTATDTITQKLIEVAPEAANAILNLVQFKGAFLLISCVVGISGIFCTVRYCLKKVHKHFETSRHKQDIILGVCMICGILFGTTFIYCVSELLSFYNWLSAFFPEGAIAFKALEAAGIDL
jgi:hypothetical protein